MTFLEKSLKYCEDVINDTLPNRKSCNFEKLSCKRQLKDLERQHDESFPYYFDEKAGDRHCRFMEKLPHVKDQWKGTLLTLEPHQVFMHHTLYAWRKKSNGFRRFTKAYFELPRKQGKSFSAAGIALYMGFADKIYGAEVYCAATTESQAQMVFKPAWQMVQMNNDLKEAFGLTLSGTPKNPTAIYRLEDMSLVSPVVGRASDGQAPSCAIIDEYHEHPNSSLLDAFVTGTGSRQQPLILIITTAGFDTTYPCYEEHLEAIKILEGSREKEHVFVAMFGIDNDDDWTDFEVWKKANPNYGVSIQEDGLMIQYQDAMNSLKDRNTLLCKHLNKWMNAGSAWMDMQKFELCKRPELKIEDFYGREVWIGVDLANKIDLCAVQLLFKIEDKKFVTFGKYYLPSEVINKKENSHYQLWRDEGLLIETEGAITDFHRIEEDIKELSTMFNIQELAFDQREASYWITNIQLWANFECVEFPQSPQHVSEPMKTLEALIYDQALLHNGDKLLTWTFGNVVKKLSKGSSSVKYYYPTKQTNTNKIDPVCALIMALGRALTYEDNGDSYNSRARAGIEEVLRVI